ncbi:hypothetical protein SAMN05421595_2786 [Austwickia chelonae]|uniref:hypothetical protein n=1 Tax=Austwickia chelonae TaxID=100225 RepID=UPI00031DDBC1|nr:hypothetical protein [Austwickia chelonae]SEW40294.1 hypothetical protein SAMN05421595_2786 [Austwickia chelonae]
MPSQVKRFLMWAFWAFVIYAIVTSPDRTSDIVRSVAAIITNAFQNIGIFFDRILNR